MPDSPGNVIRILILDDHGLFRESMSRLLAVEPDFEIVAQCATPDEAATALDAH
jgi:two-component system nitrate/nitrite response regulator NarL